MEDKQEMWWPAKHSTEHPLHISRGDIVVWPNTVIHFFLFIAFLVLCLNNFNVQHTLLTLSTTAVYKWIMMSPCMFNEIIKPQGAFHCCCSHSSDGLGMCIHGFQFNLHQNLPSLSVLYQQLSFVTNPPTWWKLWCFRPPFRQLVGFIDKFHIEITSLIYIFLCRNCGSWNCTPERLFVITFGILFMLPFVYLFLVILLSLIWTYVYILCVYISSLK